MPKSLCLVLDSGLRRSDALNAEEFMFIRHAGAGRHPGLYESAGNKEF